jgi:hypothetical protein
VEYLEPTVFSKVYDALTLVLKSGAPSIKTCTKLYVDGASGSGKTRMGMELYRRLQNGKNRFDLHRVAYLLFEVGKYDSFKHIGSHQASDAAVGCILRSAETLITNGVTLRSLDDLVNQIFPSGVEFPAEKTCALVLHIDEFQNGPLATRELMTAIVNHNCNQPRRLILPVCTGLFTDDLLKDDSMPSGAFARITLPYIESSEKAYELMLRGARSSCHTVALPSVLEDAPRLIRFLIEDTGGWPMACVQLGVELGPYAHLPDKLENISIMSVVEDNVVTFLHEAYDSTFGDGIGTLLSRAGIFKVLAMALSPHEVGRNSNGKDVQNGAWNFFDHHISTLFLFQVREDEWINGFQARSMLKYGIVYLQPNTLNTFYVRVSKPLLRVGVRRLRLLETLLSGDPTDLLPDGVTLDSLLKTCRDYPASTQETVQVISLLVSQLAWLLLEHRPPPTLLGLRPGAKVYGPGASEATTPLKFLLDAARVVDEAGRVAARTTATGLREDSLAASANARHQAACEQVTKLRAPGLIMADGTAAIALTGMIGIDGWSCFRENSASLLIQSKVKMTGVAAGQSGGDSPLTAADARSFISKMQDVADKGLELAYREQHRARHLPARKPVEGLIGLELLTAQKAGTNLDEAMEARVTTPDVSQPSVPVLLITRDVLFQALGPVFGGIAARCDH